MHRKADFVGIGAKKAATSWIAACLSDHPDIYIPPAKELHYFTKNFEQGEDWYHEQFSEGGNEKCIGEYSTSYLLSQDAPDRIHEYNSNAKLIVSLRNPVERVFSHIRHRQSKGILPELVSVREVVESKPEGGLIEIGLYAKNLKRFLEVFPKEQVHVVFYDDIQEKPEQVVKGLYNFLGVDASFVPESLQKTFNTSGSRKSIFFKIKNKIHLKLRHYSLGQKLMKILGPLIRKGEGGASQKPISPSDKAYLLALFKADIEELENLLSCNLEAWKQ